MSDLVLMDSQIWTKLFYVRKISLILPLTTVNDRNILDVPTLIACGSKRSTSLKT